MVLATVMTPEQIWQGVVNSPMGNSYNLMATVIAVMVFMFAAWIALRGLTGYMKGTVQTMELVFMGLRVSFLIMVVMYITA